MDTLLSLLIFIGILVIAFRICREMICWYFKINDAISILKSIDSKLTKLTLQNDEDELSVDVDSDSDSDVEEVINEPEPSEKRYLLAKKVINSLEEDERKQIYLIYKNYLSYIMKEETMDRIAVIEKDWLSDSKLGNYINIIPGCGKFTDISIYKTEMEKIMSLLNV